uniref:Uncharacterized protein n=1 Tax=Nelumbo nucifera TaxID=4432 RepID=A0A822ZFR4_NELNU|nr:TPA_asm: hypothetical protein HUJ06_000801 [Nelumbo nucifera]
MASFPYNFFPTDLLNSAQFAAGGDKTRQPVLPHEARTREGKPKVEQLRSRVRDNFQFYFFPTDLLPSLKLQGDEDKTQKARGVNDIQTQYQSAPVQTNPQLSLLHLSCVLPISGDDSASS